MSNHVKKRLEVQNQLDFAEIMIKCQDSGSFYFTGTVVPQEGDTSTVRGSGYAEIGECMEAAGVAIHGELIKLHGRS